MKQGKPTAARTDSPFVDQLRKLHGDLHVVGKKAMECVVPAKIQAKAADFLHGLRDAPDMPLRAMDAAGYAIDTLLCTPSMSGHTAIDRAIRTGKVGGAEMEAANFSCAGRPFAFLKSPRTAAAGCSPPPILSATKG